MGSALTARLTLTDAEGFEQSRRLPRPAGDRTSTSYAHVARQAADGLSRALRWGSVKVRSPAGLVEVTMHTARFSHSRLAAYHVILEALVRGDAIARALPRGYAKLADQLRRALLGAFLQFAEGAAREGADRKARLRCARAEAGEAAAALEAARALQLAPGGEPEHIIALLDRFAAMATGLGQLGSH